MATQKKPANKRASATRKPARRGGARKAAPKKQPVRREVGGAVCLLLALAVFSMGCGNTATQAQPATTPAAAPEQAPAQTPGQAPEETAAPAQEDFEEVYRTARFLYILYINEIMRTGVFPNL